MSTIKGFREVVDSDGEITYEFASVSEESSSDEDADPLIPISALGRRNAIPNLEGTGIDLGLWAEAVDHVNNIPIASSSVEHPTSLINHVSIIDPRTVTSGGSVSNNNNVNNGDNTQGPSRPSSSSSSSYVLSTGTMMYDVTAHVVTEAEAQSALRAFPQVENQEVSDDSYQNSSDDELDVDYNLPGTSSGRTLAGPSVRNRRKG